MNDHDGITDVGPKQNTNSKALLAVSGSILSAVLISFILFGVVSKCVDNKQQKVITKHQKSYNDLKRKIDSLDVARIAADKNLRDSLNIWTKGKGK